MAIKYKCDNCGYEIYGYPEEWQDWIICAPINGHVKGYRDKHYCSKACLRRASEEGE